MERGRLEALVRGSEIIIQRWEIKLLKHLIPVAEELGWELTSYAIALRRSGYVRYSYLLSRLLKCIMDPQYGETLFSYRSLDTLATYLLQLERVAEDPHVAW